MLPGRGNEVQAARALPARSGHPCCNSYAAREVYGLWSSRWAAPALAAGHRLSSSSGSSPPPATSRSPYWLRCCTFASRNSKYQCPQGGSTHRNSPERIQQELRSTEKPEEHAAASLSKAERTLRFGGYRRLQLQSGALPGAPTARETDWNTRAMRFCLQVSSRV